MYTGTYPNQRLSYSKKKAKDFQWGKDMMDYIIDATKEDTFLAPKENHQARYNRMMSNYRLCNNEIDPSDWERTCPIKYTEDAGKDEIQPYNITYNKLYTLLGEEWKRPFNYRAVLINEEGSKARDRKKTQLIHEYTNFRVQQEMELLSKQFQQQNPQQDASNFQSPQALQEYLQQYQQQQQEYQSKVLNPQEIDKFLRTKFLSAKEITANKILEYGKKTNDFKGKKLDGLQHGLISGEEHLWIGSRHNEPIVDVLNCPNVFYHKSPDVKYVQYGLYAGYSTMLSVGDVLDRFGEFLTEDDIKKLTSNDTFPVDQAIAPTKDMVYDHAHRALRRGQLETASYNGQYGFTSDQDLLVTHVEWKSERRVGFLTSIDQETGETFTDIVDDSYKPDITLGETIEYQWIPEVWEGVRIESDVYCCIGPKELQFRDLDNPYKVKLGYHGVVYHNMNSTSISMVERMKPFQYLYFFSMHKMLKLIARDRGKTINIDTSMIPAKTNLEKFLFYLDELDVNFYNSLQAIDQPGQNTSLASHRGVSTSAIDRSNTNQIINYINILNYLEDKIGEVAGVNRNREGQSSPYETATNAQQNIVQSSHITETYFIRHNQLWEEALNTYLTAAEEAWRGQSISKSYVLDDMSISTLTLEDNFFDDTSFGVYVTDSTKESETINFLKQNLQPMFQNELVDAEQAATILQSESIELIKRELSTAREQRQKLAQMQQQEEQQAAMAGQQAEIEYKQQELQLKAKMNEDNNLTKIKVAEITSFIGQEDQDSNSNEIPDQLEIEKLKQKQQEFQSKMNLEMNKLQAKREEADKANKLKAELEAKKLAQADKHKKEELKIKKKVANKPKPAAG